MVIEVDPAKAAAIRQAWQVAGGCGEVDWNTALEREDDRLEFGEVGSLPLV